MKQTFFDFSKHEENRPVNDYIYDIYIDDDSYQFNAKKVKLSRQMLIIKQEGAIIEMNIGLFPFNEIKIKRELKR